jgi:hypothetical protein
MIAGRDPRARDEAEQDGAPSAARYEMFMVVFPGGEQTGPFMQMRIGCK